MPITDEYMKQMITKTKDYTIVILKAAQKRNEPEAEKNNMGAQQKELFPERGRKAVNCLPC